MTPLGGLFRLLESKVAPLLGFLLPWVFNPDQIRLAPAAGGSAPSTGIQLMGLVVNLGTALADLNGLAAMALVVRHEYDAAVAVLGDLPEAPYNGFRHAIGAISPPDGSQERHQGGQGLGVRHNLYPPTDRLPLPGSDRGNVLHKCAQRELNQLFLRVVLSEYAGDGTRRWP